MHHRGHEDVGHRAALGAGEELCGNSNDLVKVVTHAKRAPDHCRILSKAARPVIIREDSERMRPGLQIVVFSEQPPQGGPQPE